MLHILVKNKRAGWGNILFVKLGRDFCGKKLRESPFGTGLRAGNAELRIRKNNEHRAVDFNRERFGDLDITTIRILSDDACLLDECDVGRGTTITDRRLIGIHLNEGIIDSHARESGKNMLDGVYLHRPLNQRGGPLDGLHVTSCGVYHRFIRKVDSLEFVTMTNGCWQDGEGHIFAGVKGAARKAG